jgi:hypothetical protein
MFVGLRAATNGLRKEELISFLCGSTNYFKGPIKVKG